MKDAESQYLGHFTIEGRKLPGVVTLRGGDSLLEVFTDKFVHLPKEKMRCIRGVARGGEKLTICDAIGSEISGTRSYHGTTKHFLSLFPNYVAVGPRHLEPNKKVIAELYFTTSGAIDLFYDIGAFGMADIKGIKKLMPTWTRKDRRKIGFSHIYYYADRGPIVSVKAGEVRIQVSNAPTTTFPSPRGINVKNEVRVNLKFEKPVNLEDALRTTYEFTSFCEIVAQNRQCVRDIEIQHKNTMDRESHIWLYVSNAETEEGTRTDFRDHLISGGLHKQEFETVLTRWMEGQQDYRSARHRIGECFRHGNYYTIDRLVGAANAFDLLPNEAVGKPDLPRSVLKSLSCLIEEARNLEPPYREQVLDNLSRVKGSNLRQKITARFKVLPAALQRHFLDLEFVVDHAVRARNYFVHGSKPKLSVTNTYNLMFYLTDTLEFIFVASDLSECGWDYARWLKQANMGRLRQYARSYDLHLAELKKASGTTATGSTV